MSNIPEVLKLLDSFEETDGSHSDWRPILREHEGVSFQFVAHAAEGEHVWVAKHWTDDRHSNYREVGVGATVEAAILAMTDEDDVHKTWIQRYPRLMHFNILGVLMGLSLTLVGCGNPVAPDKVEEIRKPMVKVDEVKKYWCKTQPRQYITLNPDGTTTSTWEVDTYISHEPCPATPIP